MEISLLFQPIIETIKMVVISTVFASLLGIPIGVLLVLTEDGGLRPNKVIYQLSNGFVNIARSIPFIILMILLFPLARFIVGTTIGTSATIVPLSIAAAPFFGRIIESALKEVDAGVLEAVKSMGANNREIVLKVMMPEALPSIIRGITMMMINLVGYSAMAGAIGGGGLGDLAIRYGYHRYQMDVLIVSVLVIIVIVQLIQGVGNYSAQKILDKR